MPATNPLCPSLNGSQQVVTVVTIVHMRCQSVKSVFSHIRLNPVLSEREATDVLSQAHALDKSGQKAFGQEQREKSAYPHIQPSGLMQMEIMAAGQTARQTTFCFLFLFLFHLFLNSDFPSKFSQCSSMFSFLKASNAPVVKDVAE